MNTIYKHLHLLFLIILICCGRNTNVSAYNTNDQSINARNNHFTDEANSQIKFHSIPEEFDYRAVRCILKDQQGIMWFGTQDGLIKFDGINLTRYEHSDENSNSISHNVINTLVVDRDNNLWIGTSRGLNRYNRDMDHMEQIDENRSLSLSRGYVKSLIVDNNNVLWVGTFGFGLVSYDLSEDTIKPHPITKEDGNSQIIESITCLLNASDENVWIGTQSGLYLMQKESNNILFNSNENELIYAKFISALEKDHMGQIWVGTQEHGLNLLKKEPNGYSIKPFSYSQKSDELSKSFVRSLHADKTGKLWIGTENNGLWLHHVNSGGIQVFKNAIGNKNSISSNSIYFIYGDDENRIWIGTYNKGINVVDSKISKFDSYTANSYSKISLPNNDISDFALADNNKVWIATDGAGIYQFDLTTQNLDKHIISEKGKKSLTNNSTQKILYSKNKMLWVGSWGGGIDLLDRNGEFVKNYKIEHPNGVGNNNVRCIFQDKDENIWVGSNGSGLYLFNQEIDKFTSVLIDQVLTSNMYVRSISFGKNNTILVGVTAGIIQLEINNQTKEIIAQGIAGADARIDIQSVDYLFLNSTDNLWIGTTHNGLYRLNNKKLTNFNKPHGLASNSVTCAVEDYEGNMWIGTNSGISKIDTLNNQIETFTREDGLISNEFKCCLITDNGQMMFGGENGFNMFYPKEIQANEFKPEINLTNLRINNLPVSIGNEVSPLKKQLSQTDTLILTHKQSSFSIDFVALNYTRSTKNQFSYLLEGFDKKWNYIGTKNTATYTQVDPGKYILKVKASNNDGIWNETPKLLTIIIKPPFWKTPWAYLIYFALIGNVLIFAIKIWQDRIFMQNQLKLEKLAKEKELELNKKNLQFFTNISHEFRTPLSLILGPLESIVDSTNGELRDKLMVIKKSATRLQNLTNNLMNIRKLENGEETLKISHENITENIKTICDFFSVRLQRKHIELSIEIDEKTEMGWFDKEKLTTILINLLSNAITHTSDNGKISVAAKVYPSLDSYLQKQDKLDHLIFDSQILEVSITDNGTGIITKDIPQIFDRFFQTSLNRKTKNMGSGVGLSLTKGLIELHNGSIWATSNPNIATCFTFAIPIDKNVYDESEIVNHQETNEKTDGIDSSPSSESINTKNDSPSVLIVEDNTELRKFLASELNKTYEIYEATNGIEGLKLALDKTPDLIISDIVMPEKDGIELCKEIKSDVRTSHIPLILLTAKTTTQEQVEGYTTGADAYITKPFNLQLLLTQINNLIQSRKELYSQYSQDVYIMHKKQAVNELDQQFLQKTSEYILNNITDSKLSIESIARHHNMSHSNVYRKIKSLTGSTIVEFIRVVRLKQALKFMESQKYNLSEVSYMTGFTSPSYFTKKFKEQYGKPPSEYLK